MVAEIWTYRIVDQLVALNATRGSFVSGSSDFWDYFSPSSFSALNKRYDWLDTGGFAVASIVSPVPDETKPRKRTKKTEYSF